MSSQTALQPVVSISTAYKIPDPSPDFIAGQTNIALQPNVTASGAQTLTPGPSPSH